MPSTWKEALDSYRYPVTFSKFKDADAHQVPKWFCFDTKNGDRAHTMEFESHFRKYARNNIEVWLEAIFWKLYSFGLVRDRITRAVAIRFQDSISAGSLWEACNAYISEREPKKAKKAFVDFKKLFGFKAPGIAVVATFPAFIDPISYPMVDTRIAKWVGEYMADHNEADPYGPQLIRPPFLDTKGNVLTIADYDFMRRWREWCVHRAHKLTGQASLEGGWRARDVEMAVFSASNKKCRLRLNPI